MCVHNILLEYVCIYGILVVVAVVEIGLYIQFKSNTTIKKLTILF